MVRVVARATQFFYERALRPALFHCDPERTHDRFLRTGEWMGRYHASRASLAACYAFSDPALTQTIAGVTFPNPIGLSAGFDKNGQLVNVIPAIGFGFMEVGSVTARPCTGNPKPRLWRLPKSRSLQVYYGLPNDGASVVAERVRVRPRTIPVGMSVAKTNASSSVGRVPGILDYGEGLRAVEAVADYLTVNVSCPNAYGGEPFTTPELLHDLLCAVDSLTLRPPIFVKLPCDLDLRSFDALLAVIAEHHIVGVVISNLTKDRRNPKIIPDELRRTGRHGGFSGAPVASRANERITFTAKEYPSRFVIVGSGGVFTADDAYEKIRRGASLIQLITGMVYQGPSLIGQMAEGLVAKLRRDGFLSIREAVGSAYA